MRSAHELFAVDIDEGVLCVHEQQGLSKEQDDAGGGWGDFARGCRSASRGSYWPDGRISIFGLRVARSVPPVQ